MTACSCLSYQCLKGREERWLHSTFLEELRKNYFTSHYSGKYWFECLKFLLFGLVSSHQSKAIPLLKEESCSCSEKTGRGRAEISLFTSVWFKWTEANCETVPQRQAGWWTVPFVSGAPSAGSQIPLHCEFSDLKFPMPLVCSLKKESSSEAAKSHLSSQPLLRFKITQELCKIFKWGVEAFPTLPAILNTGVHTLMIGSPQSTKSN